MSMLVRTVDPAKAFITLDEAKDQLNIDHTNDDALIDRLIGVVTQRLDGRNGTLNRALLTQTWKWTIDGFSALAEMPLPPLQSVSSVKYLDSDGVEQTLAADQYQVLGVNGWDKASIVEAYSASWPSHRSVSEAVNVTFVCGFGDDISDVPEDIRHAAMILLATFYENREAYVVGSAATKLPMSADTLLAPHRVRLF